MSTLHVPVAALQQVKLRTAYETLDLCGTSKAFRIKWRGAARAIVFERFSAHLLESFRRRSRKKIIPTSFRINFREQPCADDLLLVIRQLLRFLDRALKQFAHGDDCNAVERVRRDRRSLVPL